MKINLLKPILLTALGTFALLATPAFAASTADNQVVASRSTASKSGGSPSSAHDWTRNAEVMLSVLGEISTNYVDEVAPDQMMEHFSRSLRGWLDPYTMHMSEETSREFDNATMGEYGGVGAVIGKRGDRILFVEPYKGSPSDLAGFKIGDEIIAVNSVEVTPETTIESVSSRMRGTPNTQVDLTVKSVVDGSITTKTLVRKRINMPSVPYFGFVGDPSDGVGYIRHDDFTQGSAKELRSAVRSLISRGATSLILDYRANGGGVMQEAVDIVSIFTPSGTEVVSIKGRDEEMTYRTDRQPLSTDIPITLLISESSASASEIVAGALQDLDRAVIVGERSFGKGLVQTLRHVGYGTYLKLTTARYYTPSGRSIQEMDYSNHNSSARITVNGADSLGTPFTTRGGRTVYGGAGISPDLKVENPDVSAFVATLYLMGAIDDFADDHYSRHSAEGQGFEFKGFKLSDEEYALFCASLADKSIDYRSSTRRALEKLQKDAAKDGDHEILDLLAAATEQLRDDTDSNLERYSDDIKQFIENAIVLRFGYSEARIRHNLQYDEQMISARSLLLDQARYRSILAK